jgi:hypothetical protein
MQSNDHVITLHSRSKFAHFYYQLSTRTVLCAQLCPQMHVIHHLIILHPSPAIKRDSRRIEIEFFPQGFVSVPLHLISCAIHLFFLCQISAPCQRFGLPFQLQKRNQNRKYQYKKIHAKLPARYARICS